MANGRNAGRKRDTGRDGGGFVALPWSVLDSAAYMGLSPTAKALLFEMARQFVQDNNGRLLASRAYLATRGWHSAGAIQKAKAELLDAGLIFETVQGWRPNKASWYAVTWRMLDKLAGYDVGAEAAFERGAYRRILPKGKRPPPTAPTEARLRRKNAVFIPPLGTANLRIVPPPGTETRPTVPPRGAIKPILAPAPVPVAGNHLEIPSEVLGLTTARASGPARRCTSTRSAFAGSV